VSKNSNQLNKKTFVVELNNISDDSFEDSSGDEVNYSIHSKKGKSKFDGSSFDATASLQQSVESINI